MHMIVTSEESFSHRDLTIRYPDMYFIDQNMDLSGGEKILEIGAWPNYVFLFFADRAGEIVVSDGMRWGRERGIPLGAKHPDEWLNECNQIKDNIVCVEIDARSIPYEAYFDCIYSVSVLEHVPEYIVALKQMHKALKPGGKMVLTVDTNLYVGMPYREDVCFGVFKFDELIRTIRECGFDVSDNVTTTEDGVMRNHMEAVVNPSLLIYPYRHFSAGGISCVKI